MRRSAREKCNLQDTIVAILFRCVSLTIPQSSPICFAAGSIAHDYPGVKCTRRQFNRWKSPIIADDPPIYDLTSYMPAIPAFASRIFRAENRSQEFLAETVSRGKNSAKSSRARPCPVRIMIIIFPRRQNIAAIDISLGARLIPSDFFSRRKKLSKTNN